MPKLMKWKDADLEIRSRFMPQRLWLAATIDIFLDQSIILSTGGKLKFQGACVEKFDYAGSSYEVRLEWGKFWLNSVPCILYIDNHQVVQEIVNIEDWQINIIAVIFFAIFIFVLCLSPLLIGNIVLSLLPKT